MASDYLKNENKNRFSLDKNNEYLLKPSQQETFRSFGLSEQNRQNLNNKNTSDFIETKNLKDLLSNLFISNLIGFEFLLII